ncbi:MAG TPA: hypothetical protein VI318_24765 [Baekduia sp.]
MRRLLAFAAVAAPASLSLIAAGCGGGGGSGSGYGAAAATAASSPAAAKATVSTRHTALGTVLVDGQGRTLYLFEKDHADMSACDGSCATVWPPLTAGKDAGATTGGGAVRSKLTTIKRADGKAEITYAGHPLYTYAGDAKPGQTKGQDLDQFGARWYVLRPSGQKIDDDEG